MSTLDIIVLVGCILMILFLFVTGHFYVKGIADAVKMREFEDRIAAKRAYVKANMDKFGVKWFNIKTHTFRGMVATPYAMGIDLDIIRLMLGHADVSVLKHYITIHSATMIDCMKPITDEDNSLIANIGHIEIAAPVVATPSLLALPNGSCANANATEICSHANACYTCRMFRPSKCHLALYKKQLSDTEANIAIAEINGFERLLVMNQELKENLSGIITSLEKESEHNGK